MDFLTDWLTNWLKELLIGGIMGNLEGLFDTVNTQVGEIAAQVGTTPAAWHAGVFPVTKNPPMQAEGYKLRDTLSRSVYAKASGSSMSS